ncbi:hypothetical protein [Massilia sp. S19_KUP03_FR1]|uniref:hypothetical protein n=1 Tax=Massilia sp. S19_KUP03_FR1 TaxID=3025503 RepID=UPI002FCDB2F9
MLRTRGGSCSTSRQVLRSAARGHGGRRNASSLGEGFRIAEDLGVFTGVQCTQGSAAFEAALGAAQQAARRQRAEAPVLYGAMIGRAALTKRWTKKKPT